MWFFGPFFVGSLLMLGGGYAWWQLREYRLTVISPGLLYTSAAMPAPALRRLARRLGLRTVVDLRCPGEGDTAIAAEAAMLSAEGLHHLWLQSTQVPTDEIRGNYLRWMREPAHLPALIHCTHGEGRAVLFAALWRIEFTGMAPERARKKCRWLTTRGSSFDPAKPKGRYLRAYTPQEPT